MNSADCGWSEKWKILITWIGDNSQPDISQLKTAAISGEINWEWPQYQRKDGAPISDCNLANQGR
jgi:hypothetical protein